MLHLVWRTVCAVFLVLVVLAAITALLDHRWGARSPYGAAQLLADHYATGELLNGWEVPRVDAEPGRVIVRLRIPDGAAAGFQRMPDGAQFQAFGPVCPAANHPVWRRIGEGEDIYIHSVSASGESILQRLSCRHWNSMRGESGASSRQGKVASWAGKLHHRARVSLATFIV